LITVSPLRLLWLILLVKSKICSFSTFYTIPAKILL
jgi:hypothetical protein